MERRVLSNAWSIFESRTHDESTFPLTYFWSGAENPARAFRLLSAFCVHAFAFCLVEPTVFLSATTPARERYQSLVSLWTVPAAKSGPAHATASDIASLTRISTPEY